jgi:cytidine deaminase
VTLTNERLSNSLSGLPGDIAEFVSGLIKGGKFSGQLNADLADYADALLPLATTFSKAPISGFHVGAVAIGQSGKVYLGTNLEFQGVPLNASLHAEQSAIVNAWMHGEKALRALHISETPCGHCRQFLRELSEIETLEIRIKGQLTSLSQLLPYAFGEVKETGQGLLDSSPYSLVTAKVEKDPLMQPAIDAAQLSYTPYSNAPEGCVIECLDGNIFTGRSAESSAFNPSISAHLVALNQRNLSSSRDVAIASCGLSKLVTAINNSTPLAIATLKSLTDLKIKIFLMESQ